MGHGKRNKNKPKGNDSKNNAKQINTVDNKKKKADNKQGVSSETMSAAVQLLPQDDIVQIDVALAQQLQQGTDLNVQENANWFDEKVSTDNLKTNEEINNAASSSNDNRDMCKKKKQKCREIIEEDGSKPSTSREQNKNNEGIYKKNQRREGECYKQQSHRSRNENHDNKNNKSKSTDSFPITHWPSTSKYKQGNRDKSLGERDKSTYNDSPWNTYYNKSSRNQRDSNPNQNHWNSIIDEEFEKFKGSHIRYVKVKEIEGDLFAMPKEYSLAHCVAEDMNMGSGIAVQFSRQFKQRDVLYQQRQRQGGLAILQDDNRYIYYLVTKKFSNGKPTYDTLWSSLKKLQKHIEENKVKKLAIPRIACGLDRLEWSEVKAMLEFIFHNTDVEITVCNFQQLNDYSTQPAKKVEEACLVKNVTKPLVQIEAETAIVYFGSEDGYVTEELHSLNTKFKTVLRDYESVNRKVGNVVQTWSNDGLYALYGCIVKTREIDHFDFIGFQKCVKCLKSLNSKGNMFYYVGIQAFIDSTDDLLINKIINILKYSLAKVEIYVCWPGKMAAYMPKPHNFY